MSNEILTRSQKLESKRGSLKPLLVVPLPCQAQPCLAAPRLAGPGHAVPGIAVQEILYHNLKEYANRGLFGKFRVEVWE